MTDNRCKSSCSNRHAIHVSCGISPTWQGFQNTVCACLIANESSRLGWLLIAHWLFINFMPWSSLEFAKFIFSVTFPCVIFFSTPHITFLMVRPSVIRVKSRLFSPLPGWSQVLLNRHSKAPVYRHFVKCTAPWGLRAVKSALNPGFGRVKPPLCPGARGAGVSIDWCINTQMLSMKPCYSSYRVLKQIANESMPYFCYALISSLKANSTFIGT